MASYYFEFIPLKNLKKQTGSFCGTYNSNVNIEIFHGTKSVFILFNPINTSRTKVHIYLLFRNLQVLSINLNQNCRTQFTS